MKQKQVQQAKLATRRLRSRLHRRPEGAAMGNSLLLAKASLSLIRGSDDVSIGWDSSSPRTASLLCLDEMQVCMAQHLFTFFPCLEKSVSRLPVSAPISCWQSSSLKKAMDLRMRASVHRQS